LLTNLSLMWFLVSKYWRRMKRYSTGTTSLKAGKVQKK
jgi:hypothetical protein